MTARLARTLPILSLALLAACHAPSPALWGADTVSREVSVDGARFRVYRAGQVAEAHRLNFDMRVARAAMVARGVAAIVQATGCAPRPGTVEGDQAIVTARLECPEGVAGAPLAAPGPARLVCVDAQTGRTGTAPRRVMTECLAED